MAERGLADVVGFGAALGDDGVGGAGEDDAAVDALLLEDGCGFVGEQVVGGDVDLEGDAPERVGDDAVGRGGEDGGGVDEDVEAAELLDGGVEGGLDGVAVADVDGGCSRRLPCRRWLWPRRQTALRALGVAVGDDDVGAALGGEQGDFAADAAASADDRGRCGG